MTFKQYLAEAHKLTHLNHLEDLIFIEGYQGGVKAIKYLKNVIEDIKNHGTGLKAQQKFDGAPSLIAGWSPEDGRFFVASKSFFNKTPKINFSVEDIDRNHSGGLADRLKVALKYLPQAVKKGEILQGDFMFIQDDLKYENINGVSVLTFTPNTITYAVPKDTPLYKTIKKAKMGMAWHTSYTGNTLDSLNGAFKISDSQFKNTKEVYQRTTNITTDKITWTNSEYTELTKNVNNLEKSLKALDKKKVNEISSNTKLSNILMVYINQKVRNGMNKFSNNEIKGLMDYVSEKYGKDIDKLKSTKGKNKKAKEKQDFITDIRAQASTLYNLFQFSYSVQEIKNIVVDKLQEIESSETPYIKQPDGSYKITDPEGFVLSDSPESGVKFVNRSIFSKNNFNMSKF
jgi:hypothetical protein